MDCTVEENDKKNLFIKSLNIKSNYELILTEDCFLLFEKLDNGNGKIAFWSSLFAITDLQFNKPSTTIVEGNTEKVGLIPTPLNATYPTEITYTSSDSDVATVVADSDNPFDAIITGVDEGTATITATAGNVSTQMSVTITAAE